MEPELAALEPIAEIYAERGEEPFYGPSEYGPLLESLGKILLRVDDNDYQGDSRVLFSGPGRQIGYLQFGWGSCSGCDALQACESYEAIDQLRLELLRAIRWFPCRGTARRWFETHDWEGDHSWHHEEQQRFIAQAKALLAEHDE